MFVSFVHASDIVDVDHATAICVHLVKGFHNDGFTVSIHGTADSAKEFVVLDEATAIIINVSKECLDFTL